MSAGTGSRPEASGAASGGAGSAAMSPAESSERDHEYRLEGAGAAIVEGVARCGPAWVVASVTRIVDAWGRLDPDERAAALLAAHDVAGPATDHVVAMLRELFARDPAEQRATPLQIVRALVGAPTAVLRAAAVPGVVRDAFEERAFPEDEYDLSPRTLGDLGDPALGPQLLAWGLAKAAVLRARSDDPPPDAS
ncbi:MAG: hypothetical protein QOF28_2726 [Actinomycetota bacterium]|nr:hypothetical protein [Actinomycetota bacterium]